MDYENQDLNPEETPGEEEKSVFDQIKEETEPYGGDADEAEAPARPESPYADSPYASYWNTETVTPKKRPEKKAMSAGRVIGLILCGVLLGAAVGGMIVLLNRSAKEQNTNSTVIQYGERENTVIEEVTVHTGEVMTAAEVYAANVNSTVGISTLITTNYWGYQTQTPASGSGFIISSDGYILTNYHVVEDSSSVTVTTYSGEKYPAKIVGYDSSNDLAVLKIDAQGLSPVIIGDSDNLNIGDDVVAIGNPLGELTFSLTSGIISARDREITMSTGVTMRLLQTDCAINSGNSGGALFNMYGEVIGITNAKYSSSSSGVSVDNICFAIPVNDVKPLYTSIIEKGYLSKPYIGVTVTDVSEDAMSLGLPQGAAIKSVEEGSEAEKAGLKVNDIVTHMDGEAVTGKSDLIARVGKKKTGDTITLTVYRQGQTLDVSVKIGERVTSANQQPEQQQSQQSQQSEFPFSFPFIY